MTIPFSPEPIESMRARFPAALARVMASGDDPRALDACHWFDFEDGYRLNITRDRVESRELIFVCGGIYDGTPWPIMLLVARVALHFAALTDQRYAQGRVLETEGGTVMMAFDYEP